MTLQIRVSFKTLHTATPPAFAECRAVVRGNRVSLSGWKIDEERLRAQAGATDRILATLASSTREAARRMAADPDGLKFCYRWNEETCLEHYFREAGL